MKDLKYLAVLKSTPGAYNDIEFANGDIVPVSLEDRVRQYVAKILLTEKGLMPYPNYGTNLGLIPNSTPYMTDLLNMVSNEVVAAVRYAILIEESTEEAEQISEIKNLDVNFQDNHVQVNLILLTRANTEVPLSFAV